jgi:hypothetical protein
VAEKETTADGEQAAKPAPEQARTHVEVTDKNAISLYANFCRVTGTPEELILDFGLNAQPFGVPTEPVEVKQRIVTNYFTAKRMLQALHMSVQRHEQAFGVLETDVQKRVIGNRGGGRPQSS